MQYGANFHLSTVGSVEVHRDPPMACCWWELIRARRLYELGRATPKDPKGALLLRVAILPHWVCEFVLGYLFAGIDPTWTQAEAAAKMERALLPPWPASVPHDWCKYSLLNPRSSRVPHFVRTDSLQA